MIVEKETSLTFCEKPDYISYEAIHDLLWTSNIRNRHQGFVLATSKLSGEELKQRIGKDGCCFVALDGEKLIGTVSIRFVEKNRWYSKGLTPDYMLAGVLPEYQGRHVNSRLSKMVFNKLKALKYTLVELDTAEKNEHAIKVYEHLGFKKVGFKTNIGGDHYSVVMVKWLSTCPHREFSMRIRYEMRKIYVKSRYLPNGKKRIGI